MYIRYKGDFHLIKKEGSYCIVNRDNEIEVIDSKLENDIYDATCKYYKL